MPCKSSEVVCTKNSTLPPSKATSAEDSDGPSIHTPETLLAGVIGEYWNKTEPLNTNDTAVISPRRPIATTEKITSTGSSGVDRLRRLTVSV